MMCCSHLYSDYSLQLVAATLSSEALTILTRFVATPTRFASEQAMTTTTTAANPASL